MPSSCAPRQALLGEGSAYRYAGAAFTRWSRFDTVVVENDDIPAPLEHEFSNIAEGQDWHDSGACAEACRILVA